MNNTDDENEYAYLLGKKLARQESYAGIVRVALTKSEAEEWLKAHIDPEYIRYYEKMLIYRTRDFEMEVDKVANTLEKQIEQKKEELAEAQKTCDKYINLVSLDVNPVPPAHPIEQMKEDYDRLNKVREEYIALCEERRDTK